MTDRADQSEAPPPKPHLRFARYSWGVLAYNLAVILWGVVVRATGSGAGCGSHWPACDGEVLPLPKTTAMLIELSHRLTSGVALILTVVGAGWAFYVYPARHQVRKLSIAALAFMLSEALLGAALVLLKHVEKNESLARIASMSLHLTNTFLLLASLVLTAHVATSGEVSLDGQRAKLRKYALLLALVFPVGITGGIAALGDTVFPAKSLADGMARDFSGDSHLYERLRVFHPLVAVAVVVIVLSSVKAFALGAHPANRARAERWATIATIIGFSQLAWGVTNMMLLAPVPLQLGHLLLADLLWLSLVSLGYMLVRAPMPSETAVLAATTESGPRP